MKKMTDEDFEGITRDPSLNFDVDFTDDYSDEYFKKTTYIGKSQQKYVETHENIKEFDVLTSIRRGEYKEIFDSYINYCFEKGEKPKAKHLFNICNDIKKYFTTNIALDTFANICENKINYKEFFTDIDFEKLPTNKISLITGNWEKYKNSNVDITYDKLFDILKDIEFSIEKEIYKIDILFLEYLDSIEKQENKTIKDKKKELTDENFKNYKSRYLTPQKKPIPEYFEKELDIIPHGYIKSDRRTLETSVENFVGYFIDGNVIINSGILQNFNKQDGGAISPFGAQQVISRVKDKLKRKNE
jgi:hypothetical protein